MKKAFKSSIMNFIATLPMMIAVIGLVGLFQTYISDAMLAKLFGYNTLGDTLVGTLIGATSSGNAAVSYVIAQGLQEQGVSIYALSTFILAWVTLGFVQIPAEASVFGVKFTAYRNILTLLSTILVAYLSVITLGFLS
ncbi:MAG: permease [Campylobacterota bacterium]|nr:permease [Campylobacterota bacterium]